MSEFALSAQCEFAKIEVRRFPPHSLPERVYLQDAEFNSIVSMLPGSAPHEWCDLLAALVVRSPLAGTVMSLSS